MLRTLITDHLAPVMIRTALRREPDVVICPSLRRWYVVPRNRVCNVYLHQILRTQVENAAHDRPWPNICIVLRGRYGDHVMSASGEHVVTERRAGDITLRRGMGAHLVKLYAGHAEADPEGSTRATWQPCWTLFITGPRIPRALRSRHWRDFISEDECLISRGCGEDDAAPAFTAPAGLNLAGYTCLAAAAGTLIAAAWLFMGAS